MRYHLAIDIGASSGRHILGYLKEDRLILEEIYRFENRQIEVDGHICWDLERLWKEILTGMKRCAAAGKIPETVGVDTWAVDFVLLDAQDRLLTRPVAYRDGRTAGMDMAVEALISQEELYRRTGIQKQPFNTVYQLMALKKECPEQLEQAAWFLMIPEYLNYRLTGVKRNEYTNATTTNLMDVRSGDWDRELLALLELPADCFHKPAMPGTSVGALREEVCNTVGFQAQVLLPATHDTGSAFLAVPKTDQQAVYLSSGTWSLLGVELEQPITTEESRSRNFTNEGGAWRRFRFLKNIMGLWMLQSVRRELNESPDGEAEGFADGRTWEFPDLIRAASENEDFSGTVDVNKAEFLAPRSMIRAIRRECAETGQPVPETIGQLLQCIYRSLAICYRDAIRELEQLTHARYTCIHIVGGGCQDDYLNRCTARETGLPVYAGPKEGTSVGNLILQMIQSGEFLDIQSARSMVRRSFSIKEIVPE